MLLDAGGTSAAGASGPGLFDVRVPALRTASSQVASDAAHVQSAVSDAAGGSDAAAGACGGPLLAAALGA